jgi:hypothetical protein
MMMKTEQMYYRDAPPKEINCRTMGIRLSDAGAPLTLDVEGRSFDAVGATEAPVEVYDWRRGEIVKEILLMDGCEMPASRQLPLLDSHNRCDTGSVLGSFRQMKVTGDQLIGRVFFSNTPEATSPWTKAREGHLTDFSIGYRVVDSQWVPAGQTTSVRGRSFEGPVSIVTRWRVKELSICPVGADEAAKARSGQPKPNEPAKEKAMDKRLRAYLEKRGLAADATEDQAWAYMAKLEADEAKRTAPPAEPPVDIEKHRSEAAGAERERIISIDAICKRAKCDDRANGYISKGTPVEDVRREVMDFILSKVENDGGYGHRKPVTISADDRDKFRTAAVDALMLRTGGKVEKPSEGAMDLRGYSLRELARRSLQLANLPVSGNPMEMVGRALSVSDFPIILGAVANKSLMEGWAAAEETWRIWCSTGSVSDFKIHTAVRASETDSLDLIPDSMQYKYGERREASEQYSIATYGKLLAITRQAIINDDTGALSDVPRRHGEAAAREVGDVVYAVLTANANMGDGLALFVAGHNNFVANGAGAAPGVATLTAGILAMGLQTDIRGIARLNIRPQFLIAPKALEGGTETFLRSNNWVDAGANVATDASLAATRANPYAGTYFTRVYDSRLDAQDAAAWYLAARSGMTVKAFFLNGVQEPYMETRQGWNVDGVEYKVRIDVGAKAMDWRGLYFNDGN